jgi:hypothetical protein
MTGPSNFATRTPREHFMLRAHGVGSKVPERTEAKLRAAADEPCGSSLPAPNAVGHSSEPHRRVRGPK